MPPTKPKTAPNATPKAPTRHPVVLVDDDADTLESLQQFIEHHMPHLSAEGFDNPKQALKRLEAGPVRILVVDFRMPDMTGFELVRKARDLHPNLYVVLLSADRAAVNVARREGYDLMDLVLDKPLDLARFQASVDRVLGTPSK